MTSTPNYNRPSRLRLDAEARYFAMRHAVERGIRSMLNPRHQHAPAWNAAAGRYQCADQECGRLLAARELSVTLEIQ